MKKNRTDNPQSVVSVMISIVEMNDEKYVVKTEHVTAKKVSVITHISCGGKVVSERTVKYEDVVPLQSEEFGLQHFMLREHQRAMTTLKRERTKEMKSPGDYVRDLNTLIKKKNKAKAFGVLEDALFFYPDDPFLLSYYGCLDAIVNRNFVNGIETCKASFDILQRKIPFGEEFFQPSLYLNLGRAYLAAGKKKSAISAFKKGIDLDSGNSDILWEMENLGMRKKPAVSILHRSNPINKYIGMLLHKLSK